MRLIKYYTVWNIYRLAHPKTYTGEALEFIRKVEYSLTEGTCACGSKEDALREFEKFILTFPHATVTKRVRERINQIKNGRSGIRWKCISG
jgi:hypothetical protein